jgi:SAM-dependent methyltransferase
VYEREYAINRSGSGLLYSAVSGLESWMHRTIALQEANGPVLELGAGNLNHLKFENAVTYYDVCEPLADLLLKGPLPSSVRTVIKDYRDLAILPGGYAKIVSVAVLEHLEHLPYVVAQSARLLRPGGVFQAGVPSEGGALWGLSWRFSTGLSYRWRTGLNYAYLMKYEHLNTVDEIEDVIRTFFQDVHSRRFPTRLKHLSFYSYFEARGPRLPLCEQFVREYTDRLRWNHCD